MKDVRELSAYILLAEMYPYYRADVFAACLIEAGADPGQVILSRKDGLGQGVLYDIEKVSLMYPYLHPENPLLNVESGRPGIYDALPENLFYAADRSFRERDKNQILQRMKENRQAEEDVRRFFRLFEVESDAFRCYLQNKELKYDKRHTYGEFASVFGPYWEVLSLMKPYEALRFLKVAPHIAVLRGSWREAAEAVSFIMNVQVDFERTMVRRKVEKEFAPLLSEMRLGENSVLAMGDAEEVETVAKVTVSGLDVDACRDFFRGRDREKILRYLAELFLEVNTPVRIVINPAEECREFCMGVPGKEAFLGVNTVLSF